MHTSGVVTCYPQPGKRKALDVCAAFAAGVEACGGRARVLREIPDRLLPGEAVFYGVRPAWKHLWDQAVAEGRTRYYIDNGYFQRPPPDRADSGYFRVCRNAVQAAQGSANYERLAALNLEIKPLRDHGPGLVILALQSDEFMRLWTMDTDRSMEEYVRRFYAGSEIIIRRKGDQPPLADLLARAEAVVGWASNALVEAVLAGVAVDVFGESVAKEFDYPPRDWGDRQEWAARLAGSQWTAEELARGMAWQALAHA